MKLMWHSDIKPTAKVYTNEIRLPIYEAIKGLPRLLDHAQIRTEILGAKGQNGAQTDAVDEGYETDKTTVNGWVCHGLTHPDAVGNLERVKGFEPSTLTLAT